MRGRSAWPEVAPGSTPDSQQQKYTQTVVSTWIAAGSVRGKGEEKRFRTAWTQRRHRADSKTAASATPDPCRYFAANSLALSATRAQPPVGSVQINLGELPPPAHAALFRRLLRRGSPAQNRAATVSRPSALSIRPGYASKPVMGLIPSLPGKTSAARARSSARKWSRSSPLSTARRSVVGLRSRFS